MNDLRGGAVRRCEPVGDRARLVPAALLLVAVMGGCASERESSAASATVRVAAAADLSRAFEELARDFERETGLAVSLTFGSSGLLAHQLRHGAPFDVYAAADASFVEALVSDGVCDGATVAPYARGRLAVWARTEDGPPKGLDELAHPRLERIAIAHPEHAPYGRAAREALERAGLWTAVAPRLVYGENVRQALQFAQTGNAQAALVALGLVIDEPRARWFVVDEQWHAPLEQTLVVCARHQEARRAGAEAFARFVGSAAGRVVMRRWGFEPPAGGVDAGP
ncbi:MAG: molybdate ABC transporter substrate-binding protein [Myxococcota bacterium]|nr:molybdate ABC transporter substrate-binding protein [Myxococcota bacterium]